LYCSTPPLLLRAPISSLSSGLRELAVFIHVVRLISFFWFLSYRLALRKSVIEGSLTSRFYPFELVIRLVKQRPLVEAGFADSFFPFICSCWCFPCFPRRRFVSFGFFSASRSANLLYSSRVTIPPSGFVFSFCLSCKVLFSHTTLLARVSLPSFCNQRLLAFLIAYVAIPCFGIDTHLAFSQNSGVFSFSFLLLIAFPVFSIYQFFSFSIWDLVSRSLSCTFPRDFLFFFFAARFFFSLSHRSRQVLYSHVMCSVTPVDARPPAVLSGVFPAPLGSLEVQAASPPTTDMLRRRAPPFVMADLPPLKNGSVYSMTQCRKPFAHYSLIPIFHVMGARLRRFQRCFLYPKVSPF